MRSASPAILPDEDRATGRRAIDVYLAVSLDAATGGDYVGMHWLASFALLALDDETPVD